MSESTATRQRPLSPHLFIYKPIPNMVMSIVHRITGAALYFGTILVAAWLIAAASSAEAFAYANWAFGSWLGQLVLLGYTWALLHHMLGGIRHLIWDTGTLLEKRTANAIAWSTLAGSIVLTVVVWVVAYASRGMA